MSKYKYRQDDEIRSMSESRLKARRLIKATQQLYARNQELEAEMNGLLQTVCVLVKRAGGTVEITAKEFEASRLQVSQNAEKDVFTLTLLPEETSEPEVIETPTDAAV